MKRTLLLSFILLISISSWGTNQSPADFRVVCKDGTTFFYPGTDTEMTFNEDGTILFINNTGATSKHPFSADFALDAIEAIEFAAPNSYQDKYSFMPPTIDVAIDPSDDTSYTEIPEEVITDDTHDDYGDFIENYIPSNRVTITYNGTSATYTKAPSGVMVMANGADITIISTKKNIAYTLKGTTTNGSFKLYSDYKTQVTLDNVSITNTDGAAINIQSGKTIMVEVKDGTNNTLEDGTTYTMVTNESQKGTFFSEGQLVFTGNGVLNIKSNYGHGLASDDYIRIRQGYINIHSIRDGIHTNDRFLMYKGTINVQAKEDGIDVGKGYVELYGGELTINAGDEGLTASYEGEDDGTIDPLITPYIAIKGGLTKVNTIGDKGHGIRAMASLSMTGGILQVTTEGAGSKAIMAEGDIRLTGGKLTAFTTGSALYESDINELSSSAALRSKGTLTIEDMTIGLKSTGKGAKAINNIGDIILRNCTLTALATGENHKTYDLDSHSRGIITDGNLTAEGCTVHIKSYDEAIQCGQRCNLSNTIAYAFCKKGSQTQHATYALTGSYLIGGYW